MIDPKELRIGNYLKCRDDKAHGEVLEICYIGKDGAATINGWSYKEWSPIPLTPNLLLANCGFHKDEEYFKFQPDFENIEYSVVQFPEGHWIVSKGFINYNHELRSIKYLHELQNLLWEVGRVELPINL